MDSEEYRKKLEWNIIKIIQEKLQKGEMDASRAEQIAKLVLQKLHPPLSLEQIHQIAPTLDDEFNELVVAILPVIKDHQQEIEAVVEVHALKLIKLGKFDEATRAIKGVTDK